MLFWISWKRNKISKSRANSFTLFPVSWNTALLPLMLSSIRMVSQFFLISSNLLMVSSSGWWMVYWQHRSHLGVDPFFRSSYATQGCIHVQLVDDWQCQVWRSIIENGHLGIFEQRTWQVPWRWGYGRKGKSRERERTFRHAQDLTSGIYYYRYCEQPIPFWNRQMAMYQQTSRHVQRRLQIPLERNTLDWLMKNGRNSSLDHTHTHTSFFSTHHMISLPIHSSLYINRDVNMFKKHSHMHGIGGSKMC